MGGKPGGKTTEFWLNALGPYGVVLLLLYGVLDEETIALIKVACEGLPAWAQALATLAIKLVSVGGGVLVGAKAVDSTRAYTELRSQIKLQGAGGPPCPPAEK